MAERSEIETEVGRTLQRLRQERNLTVTELGIRAQVSTAMISRVENGRVSPSLSTLQALADAMSVPLMALFTHSDMAADVHHVRAGMGLQARRITQDHAHDYLLLGRHGGPGGSFQSARIRIARDRSGRFPRYQHEGHVFIYLIKGEAVYGCGASDFPMCAGDSLSFDAKLPHGIRRIISEEIEFIAVSSRPQ